MIRIRQLRELWTELCQKHFYGVLHPVPIRITRSRRTYGYFHGPNNRGSASIRISKALCETPQDIRDTLLHEMVHQYLYELCCPDWDQHGANFQREHKRVFGEPYVEP